MRRRLNRRVSKQAISIDANKFRLLMRSPHTAAQVGVCVSPLATLCAVTDHSVTKSPNDERDSITR